MLDIFWIDFGTLFGYDFGHDFICIFEKQTIDLDNIDSKSLSDLHWLFDSSDEENSVESLLSQGIFSLHFIFLNTSNEIEANLLTFLENLINAPI